MHEGGAGAVKVSAGEPAALDHFLQIVQRGFRGTSHGGGKLLYGTEAGAAQAIAVKTKALVKAALASAADDSHYGHSGQRAENDGGQKHEARAEYGGKQKGEAEQTEDRREYTAEHKQSDRASSRRNTEPGLCFLLGLKFRVYGRARSRPGGPCVVHRLLRRRRGRRRHGPLRGIGLIHRGIHAAADFIDAFLYFVKRPGTGEIVHCVAHRLADIPSQIGKIIVVHGAVLPSRRSGRAGVPPPRRGD